MYLPIVDNEDARKVCSEIMELSKQLGVDDLFVNGKPPYDVEHLNSILQVLKMIRDDQQ